MAIAAREHQSKEFEPCPRGVHQCVLIGIVDRGEQPNQFKGGELEHKLSFHFEIPKLNENGERYQFSKWVKNSTWFDPKTGKMSGMMDLLTQALDVNAEDITPKLKADLEAMCGLNFRVRISHKAKENGGTKAEIQSIEPWDGGELLEPSQGTKDGQKYEPKSFDEFWKEVREFTPAQSKHLTNPSAASSVRQQQKDTVKELAKGYQEDDSDPFADE